MKESKKRSPQGRNLFSRRIAISAYHNASFYQGLIAATALQLQLSGNNEFLNMACSFGDPEGLGIPM